MKGKEDKFSLFSVEDGDADFDCSVDFKIPFDLSGVMID